MTKSKRAAVGSAKSKVLVKALTIEEFLSIDQLLETKIQDAAARAKIKQPSNPAYIAGEAVSSGGGLTVEALPMGWVAMQVWRARGCTAITHGHERENAFLERHPANTHGYAREVAFLGIVPHTRLSYALCYSRRTRRETYFTTAQPPPRRSGIALPQQHR